MKIVSRIVLASSVVALGACAPLPPLGAVFVAVGPPAYYRDDAIGVAPGPNYLFIRGYWGWRDNAYVWVPGRWVERPYPSAVWVQGRWYHARQGWYREEGHWRGERHGEGRGRGRGARDH